MIDIIGLNFALSTNFVYVQSVATVRLYNAVVGNMAEAGFAHAATGTNLEKEPFEGVSAVHTGGSAVSPFVHVTGKPTNVMLGGGAHSYD